MPIRSSFPRPLSRHYIREWRKFRDMNQTHLAELANTSIANLSRIENGHQGYTQEMLESLAEALGTDPVALLSCNPAAPDAIWPIWKAATPAQRAQIVEIAAVIIKSK